ncbi:MAG: tetraacyldisaccharide 4'-kinase [Cyclobacteriaceae bacterium]|nr:tetraacyldisaccharide 4'-kinase [Cyclobacteriaceae bacterium]
MSVLRFLLFPFAALYDVITAVRNRLYDRGYKPAVKFDVPIISVGNLAAGGTGKTPLVEHLIRMLSPEFKIATLSRGYARKTKGFRIAQETDSAATLGDEPFQIYKKFGNQIYVAVGEERAYAIPMLLQEHEDITAIIMDDAYQHRSVTPGLSILLTEYQNPFYDDFLLPVGRLREAKSGAERADVIVVTKCPDHISDDEVMEIEGHIHEYAVKPVFFSKIRYAEPVGFGRAQAEFSKNVILVSAIANSHILEEYVRKSFTLVRHFSFRDHYVITAGDLRDIEAALKKAGPDACILTTEKDMVKLKRDELKEQAGRLPIFYLPIETEFIRNGKDFDTLVLSFLRSFKPD